MVNNDILLNIFITCSNNKVNFVLQNEDEKNYFKIENDDEGVKTLYINLSDINDKKFNIELENLLSELSV